MPIFSVAPDGYGRSSCCQINALVLRAMILKRNGFIALLAIGIFQPALCAPVAEQQRTGAFSFAMTPEEDLGEIPENFQSVIASDEQVVWEAYVPQSYSADSPPGVIVYVSPSHAGALPRGWASVLDKHNLIWISANQSGNRVVASRRIVKAILGLEAIRKQYAIDDTRIYIAGFSGGGKVASMIARDLPTVFVGGIFICGVIGWGLDEPPYIEAIRSNRYVFLTGESDQALWSTRRVYRSYKEARVPNIKLIIVRGMGHSNPPRRELNKAIEFLETGTKELR
jgi:dienelactone hydrolase